MIGAYYDIESDFSVFHGIRRCWEELWAHEFWPKATRLYFCGGAVKAAIDRHLREEAAAPETVSAEAAAVMLPDLIEISSVEV